MRRVATNLRYFHFLSSSARSSCSCHLVNNIISIESSSTIKSSRSTNQQLLVGSTSTRQLSSHYHHNSRIYRPTTVIPAPNYTISTMSTKTNSDSSTSTDGTGTNTTSQPPTNMVVPDGHELITEGTITMLYPKSENSVFYNPVQVQNRDLSVLMIGMYAERSCVRR